ncbi:nitrite reductase (NO-forming) [Anaerolineae bacterium]|nr:nitrite reductase (NO-forming) [Anaerolineae bacterium]
MLSTLKPSLVHTAPALANVAQNPALVGLPIQLRPGGATPRTVTLNLKAEEVIAEVAPGMNFSFWTFNGAVPGPMLRVMEGDTVVINLSNDSKNTRAYAIDMPAELRPNRDTVVTNLMPGETATLTFSAAKSGAYAYYGAGAETRTTHAAHGMFGLLLVEPLGGLPLMQKEFYIGRSEWYLGSTRKLALPIPGLKMSFFDLDEQKILAEQPDFFTFNGHTQALQTIFTNIVVDQYDQVRLFFVASGPNKGSDFYITGQIFDKVYTGHLDSCVKNARTAFVAPGSAAVFELDALVPGKYIGLDHALYRMAKGAVGFLQVNQNSDPFHLFFPKMTTVGI